MTPSAFNKILEDVPDEQRRLLEQMLMLGLVAQFVWNDTTGAWAIQYTPEGQEFVRLIKAVSAPEPHLRLARLLALDGISDGGICLGGFAEG
jgi:hypothetical protein